MNILELNHVSLHVADVRASKRFYETCLKLAPIPRPAFDFDGAWLRLGQTQELHLIEGRTQAVHSGNRSNHFALLIDDVAAWEAHLAATGAEYFPPKARPDGAVQLFVRDPDGHFIELCTAPAKTQD